MDFTALLGNVSFQPTYNVVRTEDYSLLFGLVKFPGRNYGCHFSYIVFPETFSYRPGNTNTITRENVL